MLIQWIKASLRSLLNKIRGYSPNDNRYDEEEATWIRATWTMKDLQRAEELEKLRKRGRSCYGD